ncbi:MAG: DUF4350 domain-containing protein [Proteobacteria bacterium]|nr:DUF4350 domain-containing protein [Pseudomonadota bacterium]MBU1649069.1 DUF4350 domain-containing protein [Pseudomonadota bacterium]
MVRLKRSRYAWFLLFLFFLPASATAGPTVLFDQSHGQRFLIAKNGPLDLSQFASLFSNESATLIVSDKQLTTDSLSDIDILIISGPFLPITEPEINAIAQFIDQGGRLAIMAHISSPLTALLQRLEVSISSAPIYEQQNILNNNGRDFMVNRLDDHPLTQDLDGFMVYGCWALMGRGKNMQAIASTSQDAWVDLNNNGILNEKDAKQAFSLIVVGKLGQGSFAVFGDDAIFQNQFLTGGNLLLARNLARWFCPSGPSPTLF